MAEMNDDPRTGAERPLGQEADASPEDETVVIRAEIVETRERMSETLDEIGERLNPHVLREQVTEKVKDSVRDATIGRVEHMARNAADTVDEARTTMADTIRDNPIPSAMVAVGLGWLLWNGRRSRSQSRYYGYAGRDDYERGMYAGGSTVGATAGATSAGYPYGSGNLYSGSGSYSGSYAGEQYGAGSEEEGTMERAKERVGELGHSAKERASDVAHRAQGVAHSVADRTRHMGSRVADTTRRSSQRVEESFYENPLAMGAVTMAIGMAAGLVAPRTEREARLMGGAREKVVDRVKEVAHETREKAQHVASRAIEETKTAAREEGLAPG